MSVCHPLIKQFKSGRRGEIRTPDILLPKQARYQATLHAEGPHYTKNKPPSQQQAHYYHLLNHPMHTQKRMMKL